MNLSIRTVLLGSLSTFALFAQDPPRGQDPHTNPPATRPDSRTPTAGDRTIGAGQQASSSESDSILATWLLVGAENGVAISQLAVQRATDPEVKAFAQKQVDEHTKCVQKLQGLTNNTGATNRVGSTGESRTGAGTTGNTADADRARTDPDRARGTAEASTSRGAVGSTAAMGGLDHSALIRDLGRKCQETARNELSQKSGAEFDKCYIAGAAMCSQAAADQMEVFQKYSSAELKTTLTEGVSKAKQTHEEAKSICKRLEGAHGTNKAAGTDGR